MRRALSCLLLTAAVLACSDDDALTVPDEQAAPESIDDDALLDARLMAAPDLSGFTKTVMALPGVTGTAVGLCGDTVCIKVYLTRPDQTVMEQIPETFRDFKVDVEVSGEIRAREGGTSR